MAQHQRKWISGLIAAWIYLHTGMVHAAVEIGNAEATSPAGSSGGSEIIGGGSYDALWWIGGVLLLGITGWWMVQEWRRPAEETDTDL